MMMMIITIIIIIIMIIIIIIMIILVMIIIFIIKALIKVSIRKGKFFWIQGVHCNSGRESALIDGKILKRK